MNEDTLSEDKLERTLDASITFRLYAEDKERLQKIVDDSKGRYKDLGHILRCAIQKTIRESKGDVE